MKQRSLLANFILFIMLSVAVTATLAQELCETLVREAWELATENCEAIGGQAACYGYDSLTATFKDEAALSSFRRPSDQAELGALHTVRTMPFDENEEEWGISDFHLPAAHFGGHDADSVIIFTTGDVIVENAAEDGSDLQPMQAFNFTTGGNSGCREAPNAVFIQSPRGLTVDLRVNSTPIRIGSSIVLGTEPDVEGDHDLMWFGVMEGTLIIHPDTALEVIVPEGEFTTTLLSDDEGLGIENETAVTSQLVPVLDPLTGEQVIGPNDEPFYRKVPVDTFTEPEKITFGGDTYANWEFYQFVNYVPQDLLTYSVVIPEQEDNTQIVLAAPLAQPTATPIPLYAQNWCDPGMPWGDGRCDVADPFLRDWFFQAGWYNAAYARGAIDSIPVQYHAVPVPTAGPTSVPPTLAPTSPNPSETPIPTATTDPLVCVDLTVIYGQAESTMINTTLQAQSGQRYDDAACTVDLGFTQAYVFADSKAEADADCAANFPTLTNGVDWTAAYPQLWVCVAPPAPNMVCVDLTVIYGQAESTTIDTMKEFQPGQRYDDAACTVDKGFTQAYVFADSKAEADADCVAHFPETPNGVDWTAAYPRLWVCVV